MSITFTALYRVLENKKVYWCLILLNVLVSGGVFFISSSISFPDEQGYWLMGESLLHGKFSSWYFLEDYYPETLRTPGYPIFLAICQLIFDSVLFVKIVQLFIYWATVLLCLDIIRIVNSSLKLRNLFLILLIPNIQIAYYSGYISAEVLAIFFVILLSRLILRKNDYWNALLLAFVSYCLFIIKPAFLLFPILLCIYFILISKRYILYSTLYLSFFCVLLIPFGIWNYINHGKFKVTSIEGGAGVAHMGYWQLKLPDGYHEPFYWDNNTSYDYTKPQFYSHEQLKNHVSLFENEWKTILNQLKDNTSTKDSINRIYMKRNNPGIFVLNNSKFTLEREKLLWNKTINNIFSDPWYYAKSRFYHLFRFYVTGINYKNLDAAKTTLGTIKVVYPFMVTLVFIFSGLIFSTFIFLKQKNRLTPYLIFIVLAWYISVVHLPFAIQARYTIPVHLLILITLSISINKLIIQKNE